ncbi:hypothetical protein TNCV_1658381 [Trichonephila clavipes]|nr:hypothetical protein TNCV_1658381 [Trichonephila clavipes]
MGCWASKRNAKRSSIPYLDCVCGLMWVGLPGILDSLNGTAVIGRWHCESRLSIGCTDALNEQVEVLSKTVEVQIPHVGEMWKSGEYDDSSSVVLIIWPSSLTEMTKFVCDGLIAFTTKNSSCVLWGRKGKFFPNKSRKEA